MIYNDASKMLFTGEIWPVHKKAFFDESSHKSWQINKKVGDLTLIIKKDLKLGVTIIKYMLMFLHI